MELEAQRVCVDAKLWTERYAGAGIALAEDAVVRAILHPAVPGHDEVARRVRSRMREYLPPCRIGVDTELGTDGSTRAQIALTEDTVGRAVLTVTIPDHDEVA